MTWLTQPNVMSVQNHAELISGYGGSVNKRAAALHYITGILKPFSIFQHN